MCKILRSELGRQVRLFNDLLRCMCYTKFPAWVATKKLKDHRKVVSAVDHWAELGLPHEKMVLGIPLYARIYRLAQPSENGWGSRALAQAVLPFNKETALPDEALGLFYNRKHDTLTAG
ncbi:hypothetical protein HPB49_004648 [Dermacentor silvarum]|uniref:Uncharacterized protein n=1 Tax=Dermacentor silvarum TaxID=543639 RepID=A0ACB8DAD2_DERSI|nr:hypothetical protein HPB49_004648 [Dermacentor silvarum]